MIFMIQCPPECTSEPVTLLQVAVAGLGHAVELSRAAGSSPPPAG